MTTRRLTVAAVLLLPVASGAVAMTKSATVIVLSGSRSASVVVTFSRPVTVFYGDVAYGERGPTITGGDPAGFVLARLNGQVLAGAVATAQASMDGTRTVAGPDGTSVRLPRGSYRLTLVASGATQVRIPTDGLTQSVTYRPSTSATVRVRDVPARGPGGAALPVSPSVEARATVTLGPRTVLIGAFRHNATGNGETTTFCVTPVGGGCPDGAVYVSSADATQAGRPQIAQPNGFTNTVVPGMAGVGRYDVVWSVQAKGVSSDAHAVLLTVD